MKMIINKFLVKYIKVKNKRFRYFEKYRMKHDKLYKSDFDLLL